MPAEDPEYSDVSRYATLGDYLRVIRERWKLIAAITLMLGIAALAYSVSQDKIYAAESTLSPRSRSADIGLIGSTTGPAASPTVLTAELAAIAERDSIANRVRRSLDTSLTAGQIGAAVTSSIDPQTNLVQLTARWQDPKLAAELANEYARQVQRETLLSERDQIDDALGLVRRQLREAQQAAVIPNDVVILKERLNRLQTLRRISSPTEIVATAGVPGRAVSPRPARNTMLGLIAGLFLGIVAAFARDSLDTRLKSPREIEDQFGLARAGQFTDSALGRSLPGTNGRRRLDPIDLEAARIMRTNLESLRGDGPPRSLVVTSPLPSEGKTTVAVSLAWASAVAGKRTLLVECDLRQPAFAERLGLRSAPGLTEVMLDRAGPQDVLQGIETGTSTGNGERAGGHTRLACIAAGTPVSNPAEILASPRFAEFLEQVTSVYDLIVLDTSPLLSVVDTRELLPLVDGVVICARSYQTTRDQARATRKALDHASTGPAALVVTGVKLEDDDYSAYYRRYINNRS